MRSKKEIHEMIRTLKDALSFIWGEADECEDAYIEGAIQALKWVLEEVEKI